MTYQEFVHYLNAVGERRETVQSADVTLEYIRQALFAWFGIKEPGKADHATPEQMERINMPKAALTEKEKNAWIAAGYPSLKSWLPKYRKQKK